MLAIANIGNVSACGTMSAVTKKMLTCISLQEDWDNTLDVVTVNLNLVNFNSLSKCGYWSFKCFTLNGSFLWMTWKTDILTLVTIFQHLLAVFSVLVDLLLACKDRLEHLLPLSVLAVLAPLYICCLQLSTLPHKKIWYFGTEWYHKYLFRCSNNGILLSKNSQVNHEMLSSIIKGNCNWKNNNKQFDKRKSHLFGVYSCRSFQWHVALSVFVF